MVVSLRRFLKGVLFILLLAVLTVSIFSMLKLIASWIRIPDPYAVPQGNAVKAYGPMLELPTNASPAERLRWFYLTGE